MDCNTDVLPVGVTELSSCRTNATLTGPRYCSATADVPTENECSLLKQISCMEPLSCENSKSRCKSKATWGSSRDIIFTLTKWMELIKGRSNKVKIQYHLNNYNHGQAERYANTRKDTRSQQRRVNYYPDQERLIKGVTVQLWASTPPVQVLNHTLSMELSSCATRQCSDVLQC